MTIILKFPDAMYIDCVDSINGYSIVMTERKGTYGDHLSVKIEGTGIKTDIEKTSNTTWELEKNSKLNITIYSSNKKKKCQDILEHIYSELIKKINENVIYIEIDEKL